MQLRKWKNAGQKATNWIRNKLGNEPLNDLRSVTISSQMYLKASCICTLTLRYCHITSTEPHGVPAHSKRSLLEHQHLHRFYISPMYILTFLKVITIKTRRKRNKVTAIASIVYFIKHCIKYVASKVRTWLTKSKMTRSKHGLFDLSFGPLFKALTFNMGLKPLFGILIFD